MFKVFLQTTPDLVIQFLHFATGEGGTSDSPDAFPLFTARVEQILVADLVIGLQISPITELIELLHQHLFDQIVVGYLEDRSCSNEFAKTIKTIKNIRIQDN